MLVNKSKIVYDHLFIARGTGFLSDKGSNMAIGVKIKCSDCGTVVDRNLHADDTEIICPECRRNMPNLPREEYRDVERTLSGQRTMGIVALVFLVGAIVLFVFYAGAPDTWVSTDNPEYVKRLEKSGLSRAADTSMFLYGAGGCILLCGIFGLLSARKRYVVEF